MTDYDDIIKIKVDHKEIHNYLLEKEEISFANIFQNQIIKSSILSIASFFESRMSCVIFKMLDFGSCEITKNFINKSVLSRKYHQLFNWNQLDANQFYSFFGKEFLEFMKEKVKNDQTLKQSINDFMSLGSLRNKLVHCNFAVYEVTMSFDEIYIKFESANYFLEQLEVLMKDFKQTCLC